MSDFQNTYTVIIHSLGCAKNLVDAEKLSYQLTCNGYKTIFANDDENINVKENIYAVVINTCGFIDDAKEESIQTILFWEKKKQNGLIRKLFVMGCLSELHKKELKECISKVDAWFGKFDYLGIVNSLPVVSDSSFPVYDRKSWKRSLSGYSHYSYVKISEGCDRACSFCTIPLIVGRNRSRNAEEIVEEVKWMVSQGVKEVIVVAQDTSAYATDESNESKLPQLIESIAQITGVEWIRIHYTHPFKFPLSLIDIMKKYSNICRYIDIPFQHCSDRILQSMHRGVSSSEQNALIQKFRDEVKDIAIRTTLMVGYPGETEEEFEELIQWTEKMRFNHLGAFTYCHTEGSYAWKHLEDNISDNVKQQRLSTLMSVQENISNEYLKTKIGQTTKVLVDTEEGDYYVGRTEWDSPDVDNEVLISKKDKKLKAGEFYNVKISDALPFDLYGHVVDN